MNIFALVVSAWAAVKGVAWFVRHFFTLMTALLLGLWLLTLAAR